MSEAHQVPGGRMLRMVQLLQKVPVTRRAVRLYEAEGLLHPAGKDRQGRRLYMDTDVARLQLIYDLRAGGLSVAAIRDVLDSRVPHPGDDDATWREHLRRLLAAQAQIVGTHRQAVTRVHDALLQAVSWLGAAPLEPHPEDEPAEEPPPLLQALLQQPVLQLPTHQRVRLADEGAAAYNLSR